MNKLIQQKLLKLLELKKRGIDGEQIVAEQMLEKLLSKYNISIEEIEEEKKEQRIFECENRFEQKVLCQIAAAHFPENREQDFRVNKQSPTFYALLTELEYIEFRELSEFYTAQYNRELEQFTFAFFVKHQLFPKEEGRGNKPEFDQGQVHKIFNISTQMEDITYHKRLK